MITSSYIAPLLALALTAAIAGPAFATYSLVWVDEFNGTSLDEANWTPDIGTGCPDLCGWGNNELEYYRAENVTVTDGNLVITTRDEPFGGADFTSGKITSRNKQSFLYGRVEMRAKIPTGGGMWPAFWMMPQDDAYGGWAASGEIDIMESANATTSVSGTLHFGGSFPDNVYSGGSYTLGGANFADAFHLYAVEWEPDEIRWYVDGVLYSTKTSAEWYSDNAPGNPRAPFDQEFFLILNAAIGGNYTGCTDPSCITASLPQEFLVDYVRVYADIVNDAPTVSITAPSSGGSLPPGDIAIEAEAADTDGTIARVEFYDGFTYLGEDTTAPYALLWASVPDGCYEVVARAIDDLGAVTTDAADITVGTGCGQEPFLGSAFEFPTTVQAEDFDAGGAGVAYRDADPSNNGGQYRPSEAVDIEATTDVGGGFNVGWLNPGEWLEYTVLVPVSGEYTFDVRVASQSAGGAFHLAFNGTNETGDIAVPVTGGWQAWTTVSATATLTVGTQVMRFVPTTDGFNVNYFEVASVPVGVLASGPPAGAVLFPCRPNPFNPSTTISYSLDDRRGVRLGIYDVSGRLIKMLVNAVASDAGRHEIVWNGRDETGREVSSGTYFYRLDAGGYTETREMVLLK
jgi:beta-glucanase (GH16 family)